MKSLYIPTISVSFDDIEMKIRNSKIILFIINNIIMKNITI
jgi:hypothetical protein